MCMSLQNHRRYFNDVPDSLLVIQRGINVADVKLVFAKPSAVSCS